MVGFKRAPWQATKSANLHSFFFLSSFSNTLSEISKNGISIVPPMPLEHSLIRVVDITNSGAAYLEAASNVIPFAFPARSVFIRNPASPLYLTVATLMEKITGPLSAGSLRLASTDVGVNPIVRFNNFSNPGDV